MEFRARVLCIDDDENVRNVVAAALSEQYDVSTAESGADGLAQLARDDAFAVVLSDMWMPEMDGIATLRRVREIAPDIVRVLLTGEPQLQVAIDAVNQGQIFRFLVKPITVLELRAAISDAVAQHHLITAERVLLQQTLLGSVHALIDALGLTSPLGFGRATRTKELVTALAAELGIEAAWQVELAAMLSQLATITLPADTLERACYGRDLSADEQAMIERLPEITHQLLGHIPRLEGVREIIDGAALAPSTRKGKRPQEPLTAAAQLLRVALAYDLLHMQGHEPPMALDILRNRADTYDKDVLDALTRISGTLVTPREILELPLAGIKTGMVLVEDLALTSGMLLVCGGTAVSIGLLERLRNLPRGSVREPIRVNTTRAWATSA